MAAGRACHACEADLAAEGARGYWARLRLCPACIRAEAVCLDGELQRFCQQCNRLQPLVDFEGSRRSCRKSLKRHRARAQGKPVKASRRKPQEREASAIAVSASMLRHLRAAP